MNSVRFGAVFLFSKPKTDEYLAVKRSLKNTPNIFDRSYWRFLRGHEAPSMVDDNHTRIDYPNLEQAYLFGATGDTSYFPIGLPPHVSPDFKPDVFHYHRAERSPHAYPMSFGADEDETVPEQSAPPKPVEVVLENGEMASFTWEDAKQFRAEMPEISVPHEFNELALVRAEEEARLTKKAKLQVAGTLLQDAQAAGRVKKLDVLR